MPSSSNPGGYIWMMQAACRRPEVDKDWWTSVRLEDKSKARHVCVMHCPVRAQCAADIPPSDCQTIAGVSFNSRGEAMGHQPKINISCDICEPTLDNPSRGIYLRDPKRIEEAA
jgi:hypothetical protein